MIKRYGWMHFQTADHKQPDDYKFWAIIITAIVIGFGAYFQVFLYYRDEINHQTLRYYSYYTEQAKNQCSKKVQEYREEYRQMSECLTERQAKESQEIGRQTMRTVRLSYYTASRDETDEDFCITADGTNICKGSENIIASNWLPFGAIVRIDGVDYRVADRMNKRYGYPYLDVLVKTKQEAFEKGREIKEVIIL